MRTAALLLPDPRADGRDRKRGVSRAPLMYKGLRTPESVLNLNTADDIQITTQGYGVGNWYLVNGDRVKAREVFDRVLAGKATTAFGYIAAEADVKRGF
jgi:hypothetical protein